MLETIESPYIHAATDALFQSLVLDNSAKGPVLVNFWSKKAPPCLRQYPILDQLVHAYQGKFLLINIDANKEIICCKDYGISSLPTLKLFRHAQVLKTLHGFQDEPALRQLIEAHISRDSDQQLQTALAAYSQGKIESAYDSIAQAIIDDPDNPRLPLALAKLLMHEQRQDEAEKLLNALPEPISHDPAIVQMRERLYFFMIAVKIELGESDLLKQDTNTTDWEIKQQLIAHYVMTEQIEAALQNLLAYLKIRQHPAAINCLQHLFKLLGQNPLVQKYRSQLQTLLT